MVDAYTQVRAQRNTPSPTSYPYWPASITPSTSATNSFSPTPKEPSLATDQIGAMSTLAGAAPPGYSSSSHESKPESVQQALASVQQALADACKELGLPTNAPVRDETIVDLYQARTSDDPSQREVLLESVRTIAQHKDRSGALQGFLKGLSISAYEFALITLGAGLLTSDSSLILLYKTSASQSPHHQDKAQNALKIIADHRGSELLKAFMSAEFQCDLQQPVTHSNESTKASADKKYDIIIDGVDYVKAVGDATEKSSVLPCKPSKGQQEDTTEESEADDGCAASAFHLGTIDKPTPAYGFVGCLLSQRNMTNCSQTLHSCSQKSDRRQQNVRLLRVLRQQSSARTAPSGSGFFPTAGYHHDI